MRSMLALVAVILFAASAHAEPPACDGGNAVQVMLNVVPATQVQTAPSEMRSRSTTTRWCMITLYAPDPFSGAFWLMVYTVEWATAAERRVRVQMRSARRCMPYKGPGFLTGPGTCQPTASESPVPGPNRGSVPPPA